MRKAFKVFLETANLILKLVLQKCPWNFYTVIERHWPQEIWLRVTKEILKQYNFWNWTSSFRESNSILFRMCVKCSSACDSHVLKQCNSLHKSGRVIQERKQVHQNDGGELVGVKFSVVSLFCAVAMLVYHWMAASDQSGTHSVPITAENKGFQEWAQVSPPIIKKIQTIK